MRHVLCLTHVAEKYDTAFEAFCILILSFHFRCMHIGFQIILCSVLDPFVIDSVHMPEP